MQVVWNSQKTEKLYAIDESALFEQIKKRGRDVSRTINFFELVMIGVNLGLVVFYAVMIGSGNRSFDWGVVALAGVSLFVGLIGIYFRVTRTRQERQFDQTMIGELDRAIWRLDQIRSYGKTILYWYMLPMAIVFFAVMVANGRPLFGIGFVLFMIATFYGTKWEMRTFHQPNQDDLKGLREMIQSE